jgi:hypothetical protein
VKNHFDGVGTLQKGHLPYDDECGIYNIAFFDNLMGWIRKGLKIICAGERE